MWRRRKRERQTDRKRNIRVVRSDALTIAPNPMIEAYGRRHDSIRNICRRYTHTRTFSNILTHKLPHGNMTPLPSSPSGRRKGRRRRFGHRHGGAHAVDACAPPFAAAIRTAATRRRSHYGRHRQRGPSFGECIFPLPLPARFGSDPIVWCLSLVFSCS
jgi:hypothetical protein